MKNTMNTSIDFWTLNTGHLQNFNYDLYFLSNTEKNAWKKTLDMLKDSECVDLGEGLDVTARKLGKSVELVFEHKGVTCAYVIGELVHDPVESEYVKKTCKALQNELETMEKLYSAIEIGNLPYVAAYIFPPNVFSVDFNNPRSYFEDRGEVLYKVTVATMSIVSLLAEELYSRKEPTV